MRNLSNYAATTFLEQEPIIQKSKFTIDTDKILNSIADVVFVVDEKGIFQYVSPSCFQMLGYTSAEMTGVSFLNFIYPADIEKTIQIVSRRSEEYVTSNFENRYFHKAGYKVPLVWSGRWNEQDRVFYCVARNGQESLEIQERLQSAQRIARVANYEFDVIKNCFTYTSETLFDILGLDPKSPPQLTPELFWSLVHPDDLELLKNSMVLPGNIDSSSLEFRMIRPDGKIVYLNRIREVICDEQGRPVKTIGTFQDITDRKINELAVQQSEERFRSLVQNGNDMIAIVDINGDYSFVGDNVKEHLGFEANELVGQSAFRLIHPDDAICLSSVLNEINHKESITIGPFRHKDGKGGWRWIESRVSNHLCNPIINGLVINSRDITEKKLLDDEMFKLSMLARETDNPVIIQDKARRVVWVNDAFTKLTGYSFEECIGKMIGEICDGPETSPEVIQYVQEKIARCESFHIETLNYKKNGETYWSDVSCQPMFNQKGELVQFFSIATDITARKQLEKQLEQEQRERHIKITAATLKAQEHERSVVSQELHDNVNQVLTTVKLYNEMCRDGFGDTRQVLDKSIKLLQESINEIRSLSKRLSAPSLGKIRLSESLKDLVNAVETTNKFKMYLDTSGIDGLDVGHEAHLAIYRILQEHLTNILKHAEAHNVQIILEFDTVNILMSVTDNGKGFDTNTKTSGIGIANMVTRAESLNGSCTIKSAPGEGCELRVTIPV